MSVEPEPVMPAVSHLTFLAIVQQLEVEMLHPLFTFVIWGRPIAS